MDKQEQVGQSWLCSIAGKSFDEQDAVAVYHMKEDSGSSWPTIMAVFGCSYHTAIGLCAWGADIDGPDFWDEVAAQVQQ